MKQFLILSRPTLVGAIILRNSKVIRLDFLIVNCLNQKHVSNIIATHPSGSHNPTKLQVHLFKLIYKIAMEFCQWRTTFPRRSIKTEMKFLDANIYGKSLGNIWRPCHLSGLWTIRRYCDQEIVGIRICMTSLEAYLFWFWQLRDT